MNFPELKKDFYKRFDESDNFLHFTSCGLLCTLLGHTDIESAPALTCTLSMRVAMFARKLGGNVIMIESTSNDKCLSYTIGTPEELFRGKDKLPIRIINTMEPYIKGGAQIFFDSTVPSFLSDESSFAAALAKSLLKVGGAEIDILETAAACSTGSDINRYLALLSSRKGYCTVVSSGEPKSLPLPLCGCKLLSVHCTEKEKDHRAAVNYAMSKIRALYPHTGSIYDVTPEMLQGAKSDIKDKTALRYMYHLVNENERVRSACAALKKCDTKTLFREMKISCQSMDRFWDTGREHKYLAHCAQGLDGIKAVRYWENGVIIVIDEDKINNAIEIINTKFENNVGYKPTFCVSEPY